MSAVVALRRAGYLELDQPHVVKMAKLLGAFVCVDLYFFGCDLLTEAYPNASGMEVVDMLVSGPLAPFFWFAPDMSSTSPFALMMNSAVFDMGISSFY